MRRRSLGLLALMAIGCGLPPDPGVAPEAGRAVPQPRPRIVLIERNPWLMVLGSDSPTFAWYEGGLVIYRGGEPRREGRYMTVRLDEAEERAFEEELGIGEAFRNLDRYYCASYCTDQPDNEIYVWEGAVRTQVTVYGRLRGDEDARSQTPAEFLRVFDVLTRYANAEAKPWVPKNLEVIVWRVDNAAGEPVPWPAGWPSLDSPSARRRGEVTYLPLPFYRREGLLWLLRQTGGTRPLLIRGWDCAASFRVAFPSEEAWTP